MITILEIDACSFGIDCLETAEMCTVAICDELRLHESQVFSAL